MNSGIFNELRTGATEAVGAITGSGLLWALFVLAFATVAIGAVLRAARWLPRTGIDPEGRLARVGVLLSAAVVVWAGNTLLVRLAAAAPALAFLVMCLLGAMLLAGLVPVARDFFTGLAGAARGRIGEGDRLRVGAHEGIVERAGLFSVRLRARDGARIIVPNHLLRRDAVVAAAGQHGEPVEVEVRLPVPVDEARRAALRELALLCPYREPGSGVVVRVDPTEPRRAVLAVNVWSRPAAALARAQLRAHAERLAEPAAEKKPAEGA